MDELSKQLLKEILPVEKEFVPPVARSKADEPHAADHWSHAVLLERAAYLHKMAKYGDGSASETLKEFPGHCAMLSVRGRSGIAELHENFADLFCVLGGRATLVTGGSIIGAHTVAAGEIRGDSVEGGTRQELRAGDFAHVPAGVPHQMLLSGEDTFSSLVMKIEENPA